MKHNSKKPVISSSMPGVRTAARFERKDPFPQIPFEADLKLHPRAELIFWGVHAVITMCLVAVIAFL